MNERIRLAAIGAVQGLAVWALVDDWPEGHLLRAVFVGLLTFLAVSAAVFHFAWTGDRLRRLVTTAVATGLVYGLVATWIGLGLPGPESAAPSGDARVASWVVALVVTLYVLGPFVQIHQRSGRLRFPYPDLFLHAWNNFFVALVGGLFTGALWIVLLLWAGLFDLIGIDLFEELFEDGLFAWPASGAAIGFGVALGRESERVVATLRGITLALFRGLLPLVCFVALLFLASLPVTGLEPLWATDHASQLLLTWVAVTVLLFNAVYQDGSAAEPLPAWARRLVEAGLLAMTFFLAISAWGIGLRVAQYGLTPTRMWGILVWLVLAAYALGYAGAVVRRGSPWLPGVQGVNRIVAWLVVALGLLAHTAVLDPMGWSARSQLDRLVEGRVPAEGFDYGYLRFQLGREGAERFEELARLEEHPEIDEIRKGVEGVREADNYWSWQSQQERAPLLDAVVVVPEGAQAPPGLLAAIQDGPGLHGTQCPSEAPCTLFEASLLVGEPDAWVLASGREGWPLLQVFGRDGEGSFVHRGSLRPRGESQRDIGAALREGKFEAAPSPYLDLLIDGVRYRLEPACCP